MNPLCALRLAYSLPITGTRQYFCSHTRRRRVDGMQAAAKCSWKVQVPVPVRRLRIHTRSAGLKSNGAYFGSTRGLTNSRHAPLLRRRRSSGHDQSCNTCVAQLGIFFSTSTGHTEEIAGLIKEEFGDEASDPADIGETDLQKLPDYYGLVVGAPTWNTDCDTERSGTNWDGLLKDIKGLDLKHKPVAVFGLGDSVGYGDYFCDAMEEIYNTFKATGARMVGHWPAQGYDHEGSKVGFAG
ncbi:TPA: hypothetical protein ACH3X1_004048 [Trebouxia sp. C0004]